MTTELPLISCIMPTFNRRRFLPLALTGFLSQDYPNKELLVIDGGTDPVGDLAQSVPGVRYVRVKTTATIGSKRSLGSRLARGEIIAQCDDDDWYAPNRLTYQAAPILHGTADMTGLEGKIVLALPEGEFWTITPALHRTLFSGDVHPGTLVYRKSILNASVDYPDRGDVPDDRYLLGLALDQGNRLVALANPGVYVYVRHRFTVWRFQAGTMFDPAGWSRTGAPSTFSQEMLVKYRKAAIDDDFDQTRRSIAPSLRNLMAYPLQRAKSLFRRANEDDDD